ncbi:MAG TPA: GNAT family N-acetyltransferase [Dehalococcoidia bacterium]|nr:GNAT family N-acetyltransferase [Dehalococcoidia bacterium]
MALEQTSGVLIRDARPEEVAVAGAVVRAAYDQFKADYPSESWERWIAMIGDLSHYADDGQILVAERDGEIIGSVTFYPDASKSGQGDWPAGSAGILRLAVLPSHRGGGLGRALVEECMRRAQDLGVPSVALHTTEWMAVARPMYERIGFYQAPEFDFHTRTGVIGLGYRYDFGAKT